MKWRKTHGKTPISAKNGSGKAGVFARKFGPGARNSHWNARKSAEQEQSFRDFGTPNRKSELWNVSRNKRLCHTCYKNKSEYGLTPRKKPNTCEACKNPGQHHRDSDWLWNCGGSQFYRPKGGLFGKHTKTKAREQGLVACFNVAKTECWISKPTDLASMRSENRCISGFSPGTVASPS
jgi:hypothetical protein